MLKSFVFAQSKFLDAKDRLASLGRDEDGAALIEYSLLIGLIAVAAVAIMTTVGTSIVTKWTTLNTKLS